MISNILSRVVEILSSLLVISVLVFLLIQIVPGDPIVQMLGENTTPTIVEEMRSYYGLDRPLHVQYLSWLQRVLHGDLGRSIRTRLEVSKEIMERFPSTFLLAISATALSTVLAVPIGILSAYRMNSLVDYAVRATSMVGVAMPGFVVAVLLILILSVKLDLLPISGAPAMLKDPASAVRYYVLPTLTLGIGSAAFEARIVRSSMLEVLGQPYIQVARAKGLHGRTVLWVHALKNCMIPLITVLAVHFAYLLGGAAVMEQIFGLPGLGSRMIQASQQSDYPVIQGMCMFIGLVFILANLTADSLYAVIDPRTRKR